MRLRTHTLLASAFSSGEELGLGCGHAPLSGRMERELVDRFRQNGAKIGETDATSFGMHLGQLRQRAEAAARAGRLEPVVDYKILLSYAYDAGLLNRRLYAKRSDFSGLWPNPGNQKFPSN